MAHNLKAFYALGLFGLFLLAQKGVAHEFKVGGSNGWTTPSNSNAMNQWAESNRFQIGDTLLFVYPADKDAVLQVNKDAYNNCNTSSPIAKFTDGHTEFKFKQSGPFYFISGVKDHCQKNEKLVVVVLADRTGNKSATAPMPAAASPPPSATSPPPAAASPTPSATSPPPAAASPPPSAASPPSSASAETPPSPAPTAETTPSSGPSADHDTTKNKKKNGASSVATSFIGAIGALMGSSLLLVL